MNNKKIYLTRDQALFVILVKNGVIHTLRESEQKNLPVLYGIEYTLNELREEMKKGKVELAGQKARGMNHGIAIVIDDQPPVFIETDEDRLRILERQLLN